jgi:hypothetical protein
VTAVNGTIVYNNEQIAATGINDFSLPADTVAGSDGSQAVFGQASGFGTGPRAFMYRGTS